MTPDFSAIKTKQQAAWATGNYAVIGTSLQIVPELLCESMDLRSGSKVIDIAAGNGNASLAAARRWCQVTSTDFVPELLELGRARAAAEGWTITFQTADAEALPFADNTFDAALSTFGIMFTPNQLQSAAEVFRVVRPGGTIGLANWTPTSFVGQIFKTIGRYAPPPPGLNPPFLWGTEAYLHQLFPTASSITVTTQNAIMRYLSPDHWLQIFSTFYGPMNRTFAALDEAGKSSLTNDLHALMASLNRATGGTLVLPSEYLEVVIKK